jgi:hypothetical protein
MEIRLDARSGASGQGGFAISDHFQISGEQRAQGIRVGVDFEQAIATDHGQEMSGS